MSAHNLYFEQKYKKIAAFFLSEISVFGGEVFYIFEYACFCNGYVFISSCCESFKTFYVKIQNENVGLTT